jgi:hypothetical protein
MSLLKIMAVHPLSQGAKLPNPQNIDSPDDKTIERWRCPSNRQPWPPAKHAVPEAPIEPVIADQETKSPAAEAEENLPLADDQDGELDLAAGAFRPARIEQSPAVTDSL